MGLRILHVTPYGEDAWAYGGIPRVVGALTHGLAQLGHDVTICATDACDKSGRHSANSPSDGITRRFFPNVSNRLAYDHQGFIPIGLRRYVQQHAGDFDVAHLHACRNLPVEFAAYYLRQARVPYVVQPNGTAPLIERRLIAKRLFDFVVSRRTLLNAARVLAVSPAERKQLIERGVAAESIRVIGNPVDLREFRAPIARGYFRETWGIGQVPVVLFLGKITPRKNVDVLARAFARVRTANARLVIAGNDMGGGERARRLAGELGVADRTIFTGLLSGPRRLHALADADVVVYASEHEIFGLVPFEALLAGTPVVVADDSGCGDLVGATGGGLVVPVNSADAIAHAIEEILAAPSVWRQHAQQAQPHIRSNYGNTAVSGAVEAVYNDLVTARSERVA